ncbi:Riboflavin kinase [Camelus dromedarius]|uniref:riboflavin kinase n=1 Tax=Camelus dromedarius TaxID=9838 RepID=A0A5N4EAD2_CAMDR|nr:Riboflavin kinase [Camelus dromedarius]
MRHLRTSPRRVVRGFGRGSKQLGIPTANFPEHVVDNLPADVLRASLRLGQCGGSGDVHKMVVSIGWNPYYKNTKKSMVRIVFHICTEKRGTIAAIQGDIEELEKTTRLTRASENSREDKFFQSLKASWSGWYCLANLL